MLPNPDILNEYGPGKFVLSNLAAKRAKQLKEGAPALVNIDSNHPLTIALAEIAAGKIKPVLGAEMEAVEDHGAAILVEETIPGELGMLLPALDETEVALVVTGALDDHEPDAEVEPEEGVSLADLVEEEEEEAVAVTSEDETLSLSDIADQESVEEDETEE